MIVYGDWYERVGKAMREYDLEIGGTVSNSFTAFRHFSKKDQDKILEWFRKDYPKLYSLLMEVQMFDEQYGEHPLLSEQQNYTEVKHE